MDKNEKHYQQVKKYYEEMYPDVEQVMLPYEHCEQGAALAGMMQNDHDPYTRYEFWWWVNQHVDLDPLKDWAYIVASRRFLLFVPDPKDPDLPSIRAEDFESDIPPFLQSILGSGITPVRVGEPEVSEKPEEDDPSKPSKHPRMMLVGKLADGKEIAIDPKYRKTNPQVFQMACAAAGISEHSLEEKPSCEPCVITSSIKGGK